MKRVYFVRHGEAAGNVGGFSQTADTPLTDTGIQQAGVVATRFRSLPIDCVLASSYVRAQHTAQPISEVVQCDVETSEFFHETKKPSSVAGKPHDSDVYQSYVREEKANYSNPDWSYEDGENFQQVLDRVAVGVQDLESRNEENIIVVSHGRLLRFIVSYLIHQKELTPVVEQQTAQSMVMTNTGITVFEFDGDKWKLITWNDHAHFAE